MSGETPSRDPLPPPPQPPEKPLPSDCCGGGCLSCVYDLYDQALERYERALEQWRRES